jgi:hypothetical protein
MDCLIDILTTYTRDSELQALTTLSLISTVQTTRAHAKSSQFAFTSRFLVTNRSIGVSSASVVTPLLSGEYPTTELTTVL